MKSTSIGYRILHFPLTKIVLGLLVCGLVLAGAQWISQLSLSRTGLSSDWQNLITGVVSAAFTIASYMLLFTVYEKRSITEFSTQKLLPHLGGGAVLGASLQSLTILVIAVLGGYHIVSINPIHYLLPALAMSLTSSIVEETLIRGIVFRVLEEKLGSYIALFLSALLFGILHLANPNSSWTAAIGLGIQAGILLAVAFMYTRNLWFPIALHFAWNFTQSAIFGANVSGNAMSKTWITSRIEGAEWFTGGAFGPEGSIQATIFCLIAALILLRLCIRDGKIIPPVWRKRNQLPV